jgi:hypothetical protein
MRKITRESLEIGFMKSFSTSDFLASLIEQEIFFWAQEESDDFRSVSKVGRV